MSEQDEREAPAGQAAAKPAAKDQVHLHAMCWNEARMIPYFFRHYNEVVDKFFIWDNGSTDGSLALLQGDERVRVRPWEAPGDSVAEAARALADQFWKPSRGGAEWVFVVDMDEHLFHPDMRAHLRRATDEGATAVKVIGYDMAAEQFPTEDRPLWQLVTRGLRGTEFDKMAIFDPDAIIETNHQVGRQPSQPSGRVIWENRSVLLLRYRRLGADYLCQRNELLRAGPRARDAGETPGATREDVEAQHRLFLRMAIPVPGLAGFGSPALTCSPEQELRLIRASGLFDEAFYLHRYPDVSRAARDALEHFCRNGWREGRSPNPHFDCAWYADAYGELTGDVNPLLDYIMAGEELGRRPSPEFDPTEYRFQHGLSASESALRHLLHGRAEAAGAGAALPDEFDPALYLQANPDVAAAGLDPTWHFVNFGRAEGRPLRLPEPSGSG
ncbi:MAG: glycosyltransferase family 2 protein [Alphaproteobacteria bacterium]|nr:glycosyltransferase family 2 protein [Alphaproteobacteria bacterium]